jgi:hypothetical protein
LAVYENISKYNDNYKYVIYCIDILSRYVWARPLKNKKPVTVIEALRSIFNEGRKPLRLRTDKGSEFIAKSAEKFFKDENIVHTKTQTTELKASYCERLIRTQKAVMYRYFTHNNTYRYIDKLQDFVNSYNHRVHRTIGQSPASVTKDNEKQVWFKQYAEPLLVKPGKQHKAKFKVGDLVRITHIKSAFARDYNQKWTGEVFKVVKIVWSLRIPMYKIVDYDSEPVVGSFYGSEMSKADIDPDKPYKIEKVVKTRKKRGLKEYFVKYLYWPSKFNQWVSEEDMMPI